MVEIVYLTGKGQTVTTSESERSFGRPVHRVVRLPYKQTVAQNHGQQCEKVIAAWQQVLQQHGEDWVKENPNQAAEETLTILGDEWRGWGRRQVLHAVGAVKRPKQDVLYPGSTRGVDSVLQF